MSRFVREPEKAVREIPEGRSLRSKIFDMGGKRRRLVTTIGPIHYQDDKGQWQDIDLTPRIERGRIIIDKAPYKFTLDANAIGYTFQTRNGETAHLRLLKVGDQNVVSPPTPRIEGNTIWFDNVAPGVDICLKPKRAKVEAIKIIRDASAARSFEWEIEQAVDSSLVVDLNGRGRDNVNRQSRGDEQTKQRKIEVATQQSTRIRLPNNRERYTYSEEWTGRTQKRDPETRVPKWESDAVYPVLLDPPDLSVPIVADNDDGQESVFRFMGTYPGRWSDLRYTYYSRLTYQPIGDSAYPGWRFLSLAIPQGTQITSATLKLNVPYYYNGTGIIYASDVDDSPEWESYVQYPTNQPKTTASTAITATGSLGVQSFNVTALVQEVVDRGGWSSGNNLSLFAVPTSYYLTTFEDYSAGGGNEPTLEIDFEADTGGASATAALTGSSSVLSAAATHATPTYTAESQLTGSPSNLSASATHAPPTFAAAASLSSSSSQLSASASHDGPEYTAAGSLESQPSTLAAESSHDVPVFAVDATLTGQSSTLAASASHTAPTFAATAALSGAPSTLEASAETEVPTFTAAASLASQPSTLAASATHDVPIYEAAVDLVSAPSTLSASAAHETPVFEASAALASQSSILAAEASPAEPIYSATAGLVGQSSVFEAEGTHDVPQYTAAASLIGSSSSLAATSSLEPPTFTATGSLTGSATALAASASHVVPTFAATVSLAGQPSVLNADARPEVPVYTATVSLMGVSSELLASATHDVPVYSAAVSLSGQSSVLDADATFDSGTFIAAASLVSGNTELIALATHVEPVFTATVNLVSSSTLLAVVATFVDVEQPPEPPSPDPPKKLARYHNGGAILATGKSAGTIHASYYNGGSALTAYE